MAWCSDGPAPVPTIGREVIETVTEQLAERIEDALAGNTPADALAILAELKIRIENMEADHRFDLRQRGLR